MHSPQIPHRFVAASSFLAVVVSYLTLFFALRAVNFDMDAMANPLDQIALGEEGAIAIQWSMICDAFGFYIFSIPAALYVWYWLQADDPFIISLATVSGLGYILTGALGAGILSIVWPELIRDYASAASDSARQPIIALFETVTNAIYTGMWGRIEYFLSAFWWGGVGYVAWGKARGFAIWSLLAGSASLMTSFGELFGYKVFADIGLNLYFLFVPIWTAWVGVLAMKSTATLQNHTSNTNDQ